MTPHRWSTSGKYIDAGPVPEFMEHGRYSIFEVVALDLRDVIRHQCSCDQDDEIDQAGIADRVFRAGRHAAQATASGDIAS